MRSGELKRFPTMKTKLISMGMAAGVLAVSNATAGEPLAPPALEIPVSKPVCDCFDHSSTGIDLFGVYVNPTGNNGSDIDSSLGGGLGVTSYLNSYLGFSGNAYWWHDGDSQVTSISGSMILRYPIRSLCVAPYLIGGVGGHFNSVNQWTSHVGAGIEIRVPSVSCLGIFADGTYNFADETEDYLMFRLGARIHLFDGP